MKFEETIEKRFTSRHKKSLLLAGNLKGKRVLDIGCSIGWFENSAIEQQCKKVVGIDINKKDLDYAIRKVPNAKFVEGTLDSVKFPDASFDTIVAFEVLEHIPNGAEKKFIMTINRILKKNGAFILSTPSDAIIYKLTDPAWMLGHRHYNPEKLREIIEGLGFKCEVMELRGGIYDIIGSVLFYPFKWLLKSEIPFKDYFNKKLDEEYLGDSGFVTIFIKCKKVS